MQGNVIYLSKQKFSSNVVQKVCFMNQGLVVKHGFGPKTPPFRYYSPSRWPGVMDGLTFVLQFISSIDPAILYELLKEIILPTKDMIALLKDPYANYVVQSAVRDYNNILS